MNAKNTKILKQNMWQIAPVYRISVSKCIVLTQILRLIIESSIARHQNHLRIIGNSHSRTYSAYMRITEVSRAWTLRNREFSFRKIQDKPLRRGASTNFMGVVCFGNTLFFLWWFWATALLGSYHVIRTQFYLRR